MYEEPVQGERLLVDDVPQGHVGVLDVAGPALRDAGLLRRGQSQGRGKKCSVN